MAPFPITLLPPEPHLEVRQNGAPYEITLTITRATTTLTTTMALGQATPTSPNSNPQTTQPSTSTSSALPSAAGGGGTSNSAVIGAILGSLIGFLVIMAFLWFCCTGAAPNFVFWRRSSSSDSDSYYSYSDDTTTSSGSYVRSPRKQGSFWGWPFASTAMRETVRRDVWIGERRSSGLKYSIDD
ncbi:hypothetical protein BDZ45DRAFT_180418 [Acephala macrosclerotiorum]|nr:hypothetical protein BDZ45DRAFT_180418 [Acephala macrosclerotiorum]